MRTRLKDLPPNLRKQVEGQVPSKPKPHHKYGVGAKDRRTFRGIVFGSIWEKRVYQMLLNLVEDGRIGRQVPYELLPGYTRVDGKKIRQMLYLADFVVDGEIVIDAKGQETAAFQLKKKLFEYHYKKLIHLVSDSGNEWKNQENIKQLLSCR